MLGKFSKVKRARKHGFRAMSALVKKLRRRKGRKQLTVQVKYQK